MALTTTSLALACGLNDTTIRVTSATGFVANQLVRIDDEWMSVVGSPRTTTPPAITVRRGTEGSAVTTHASGTPVSTGTSADFALPPPQAVVTPPGTGAGGASLLRQHTTIVTDTQLKGLTVTPLAVLPAPGANRVLVAPVYGAGGGIVLVHNWMADYTNIASDALLGFGLGTNGPYTTYGGENAVQYFFGWTLGGANRPIWVLGPIDAESHGTNYNNLSDFADQAVYLSLTNALGVPTGGHPAATTMITIPHYVLDVTTGAFV